MENVTLEFLGRQIERVIEEQGRMRDSIDVLTGTVHNLTLEIAGLRSAGARHERDILKSALVAQQHLKGGA